MLFNHQKLLITFLCVFVFNALICARPVSKDDVRSVVRGWLKSHPYFVDNSKTLKLKSIEACKNKQKKTIFYLAYLSPSGYVLVAANDLIEPIIAYSPDKDFIRNDNNFLWLLSKKDMSTRMAYVESIEKKHASSPNTKLPQRINIFPKKWERLKFYAKSSILTRNISSVDDPRVDPIIESEWSQTSVNSEACYNYYTPTGSGTWVENDPDNYPCGCVATAMGQIMRYFEYPNTDVGAGSFTVTVDGTSETKQLRGSDGSGGAYDWSVMTLDPSQGIVELERESIGALLYDCGLSVNMNYSPTLSSTNMYLAAEALTSTFKYENAIYADGTVDISGTKFNTMANPNLDAGSPVLIGLDGNLGKHAVICDGYGYNSGTLYHHLNMGWAGYDDAWYNLPTVQGDYADFNMVISCVYNIYTSGTGEIISGRVIDSEGKAQSNLTITVEGDSTSYTTKTDSRGIWAVKNLSSNTMFTVSCENTASTLSVTTGTSKSGRNGSEKVGNVWNVDFNISSEPAIALDTKELNPRTTTGKNADSDVFQVWNSDDRILNYTITTDASWLSVNPASGDSTGTTDKDTITVTYNNSSLSEGTYTATISVADPNASNSPQTVYVTLSIVDQAFINVDVTSINASCNYSETPDSQTINIWNSVQNTTLNFSVSSNVSWVTSSPAKGISTGPNNICETILNFNTSKLGIGKYSGSVIVSDPYSFNASVTISVDLTVGPADSVPTENLVNSYNFAGKAIWVDDHNRVYLIGDESGNDITAIQRRRNRQPLLTEAVVGNTALSFNGKQYLYTGPKAGINLGGPFSAKTITLAFRTGNDVITRQTLLAQGTSKRGFNIYIYENYVFFAIWNTEDDAGKYTGWGPVFLSTEIAASTFYCFTFVFDAIAGVVKGYNKDGSLFNTTSGAGYLYESKYGLSIGKAYRSTRFHDGKMRGKGFIGHICELFYYNEVLSSADILSISQYLCSDYANSFTDADEFVLHLDASSGIQTDTSDYLIYWKNPSATFKFKTTSNKAPLWKENIINSLPGIVFDGWDDIMSARSYKFINSSRQGFKDKTIFIVFKPGNNITDKQIIWAQGNQKTGINIYIANDTIYMGAWNHVNGNASSTSWGPVFVNSPIAKQTVYSLEFGLDTQSFIKGYLKQLTSTGTKNNLGTVTAGLLTRHPSATIGASKTTLRDIDGLQESGNSFSGTIFEVLIYNKTLISAQETDVDNYIANKYIQ